VLVGKRALLQERERSQKRRGQHLAAAVDADVQDVVGVEVELDPRAPVGDDARREATVPELGAVSPPFWRRRLNWP
jgi:hypothetical protein